MRALGRLREAIAGFLELVALAALVVAFLPLLVSGAFGGRGWVR